MHVVMVGLSHKTAPVEVREKVAFPDDLIPEALRALQEIDGIGEAAILSTCNRTEVYAASASPADAIEQIKTFVDGFRDLGDYDLKQHLYGLDSLDACAHLFRVTSSLDSMVVGEGQILAQVKECYWIAQSNGATSTVLNKLFHEAIRTGKRVRTETSIGENAVSISYAAVELAKQVFGELLGRSALLLGAGEMAELTAKHLCANGVRNITVVNRTRERAEELARVIDGKAGSFDELDELMLNADIVVSSTAAQELILEKDRMAKIMHTRKNRPIFMFDIAVPRDLDPGINDLYNTYLYDIDDLKNVVAANKAEREKEAESAGSIIEESVDVFAQWMSTREVVPTITALKRKGELILEAEVEKATARMGDLSEREANIIKGLGVGIVNKLLHGPIIKMKEMSSKRDGYVYTESLRELFDLDALEEADSEVIAGRNGDSPEVTVEPTEDEEAATDDSLRRTT